MKLPSPGMLVQGMRENRQAVVPVALLAIAATGIFSFLSIADEMAEGEIKAIDEWLFYLLRSASDPSDPLGPAWVQEAAIELTSLGGYPVMVLTVLIVVGLLLVTKRYGSALYTVLSVGLGALLSQILKEFYERPRPNLVEHLDVVHTASFPSGHAMVGTVAYLTLAALVVRIVDDRRVKAYVVCVALAMAVLIGLTRIYLGVHWPSDVAAGWALGISWASIAWLMPTLMLLLSRRGAGRKPKTPA